MSLLVLPLGPVCVPVPDGKYPLVPVNVPGIDVGYTITWGGLDPDDVGPTPGLKVMLGLVTDGPGVGVP